MDQKIQWEPYDPEWLIKLAQELHGEEWLPEALSMCTQGKKESEAYIYFVDATSANKPEAEWQFERNILLHFPTEGLIVLDVLKGNRIGGVEFVDKIK